MFLIIIALSHFGSIGSATHTVARDGTRTVVYGAAAPKSHKAQNAWDRLNLSPAGVEPKIVSKRGAL